MTGYIRRCAIIACLLGFCALAGCGARGESASSSAGQAAAQTPLPTPTATPEPPWWEAEQYRDFLPAGRPLFMNRAQQYYYYDRISEDARRLYDGMLAVMRDPTVTKYHKRVEVSMHPHTDAFAQELNCAKEALIYDHPEMFWLRETEGFNCYYNADETASLPNGNYIAMIELIEPYTTYREDMTAFNAAAEALLGAADHEQPQPLLALELHDLLIDKVSYDQALGEATNMINMQEEAEPEGPEPEPDDDTATEGPEPETDSDTALTDRGHTAYGALVANSRGEANTAVCDGYSYALHYLWQQAGIMSAVINGTAGEVDGAMELHAWNALELDGAWYEVDATWNDSALDDILQKDMTDENNAIYALAVEDPAFTEPVRHYMYALSTEQIADYTPEEIYRYETEYEYVELDVGDSVHIRTTPEEAEQYGETVSLLSPVAEGTTYTYANLEAWRAGEWDPAEETQEQEAA